MGLTVIPAIRFADLEVGSYFEFAPGCEPPDLAGTMWLKDWEHQAVDVLDDDNGIDVSSYEKVFPVDVLDTFWED